SDMFPSDLTRCPTQLPVVCLETCPPNVCPYVSRCNAQDVARPGRRPCGVRALQRAAQGRARVSVKPDAKKAISPQTAKSHCLAQGFLLCCRATQGKTDTPSWRITTGAL